MPKFASTTISFINEPTWSHRMPKEKKNFRWNTESFDSFLSLFTTLSSCEKRRKRREKEKQGGLEVCQTRKGEEEWRSGKAEDGKFLNWAGKKEERPILIRVSRLETDLINAHYARSRREWYSFVRVFFGTFRARDGSERSVYPGYQLPPRNLSSLSRLN